LTNFHFIVKINDEMGRKQTTKPTTAHSRILRAIVRHTEKGKHASFAELVIDLGLAGTSSLTPTLRVMERNGLIEIHGGVARGRRCTVSLTSQGKAVSGTGLRILGQIPAGPLSEALQRFSLE